MSYVSYVVVVVVWLSFQVIFIIGLNVYGSKSDQIVQDEQEIERDTHVALLKRSLLLI